MKYLKPVIFIIAILTLDQVFKIWVKNNMYPGEEIPVLGNWFVLHFTENNGFAFGFELGGRIGKFVLTSFRIIALFFIGYIMFYTIKKNMPAGFTYSIALIFVGATGNILDSVFYGLLFHYDTFFHGRVVDMLYFPLIDTRWPQWMPIWGGRDFVFFRPVFNLADSSITTGVFIILLFYKKVLKNF